MQHYAHVLYVQLAIHIALLCHTHTRTQYTTALALIQCAHLLTAYLAITVLGHEHVGLFHLSAKLKAARTHAYNYTDSHKY